MVAVGPPPLALRPRLFRIVGLHTDMNSLSKLINLALPIAFPIAWFAPLMRTGLLPLFGLSEISVISGLQSLWKSNVALGSGPIN